jgi:two-component system OmpR family sensor kinase
VEAIEARANGKGGRAPGETGPGRIEIAVRTTAEGWVEVSIADDGVGIPDGLLEAIFEPDRTFKARGTGLGLAIVRQVTAAHGGSVSARNRQRGAEFTVRLPGQRRGQAATTTRGSA